MFGLGAMIGSQGVPLPISAQNNLQQGGALLELTGAILNVHDPVIIKQDEWYYLFSTGVGIPVRRSRDLQDWRIARGGTVFQSLPEEASAYVPGADSIWAPDISYDNQHYHLYYAVSTFGSNRSAIGVLTNTTLHHDDDAFEWVDHGVVVRSDYSDSYNAIDPNLIIDTEGVPWLVFGSYWNGIKMIRIDAETGKQSTEDTALYDLASRAIPPHAIEAPFIIRRDGFHYLFVSFDQCCQGIHSTYNVRVGRSETLLGPYQDRDGVAMLQDGGTQITFSTDRYRGSGHNAILREGDQDYIVYHAYDAVQGGTSTLRIEALAWDEEGWVSIPGMPTAS